MTKKLVLTAIMATLGLLGALRAAESGKATAASCCDGGACCAPGAACCAAAR